MNSTRYKNKQKKNLKNNSKNSAHLIRVEVDGVRFQSSLKCFMTNDKIWEVGVVKAVTYLI